ncbi:hypothetical protein Tthe_0612 [Thermoanaerobacterium thermosaccharolyticum DSM 571]|uniref:Uncharacterized protein n=1 Tax=Thermoanaerobacterium thermosaccharolyticum (strain ATCC 7956 / DSM 571 / NCIMB 9385 / NCA 3814 / NCTC 13789 / WDCM 00135 / 2032) TaxID=580327 RepID=D9TT31_THETC|nr:hypothetical protein Tthe_0612 [Thermoanaerobacterium thermosaccharolyticum DSM 571]
MVVFISIIVLDSVFVYLWFKYLDNLRKKNI